jgi:hypothetical protein
MIFTALVKLDTGIDYKKTGTMNDLLRWLTRFDPDRILAVVLAQTKSKD